MPPPPTVSSILHFISSPTMEHFTNNEERSKTAGCMVLLLDGFLPNLARETARKTRGTLYEQVGWFSCKTVTYDTLRKSNLSRKPSNTLRTMRTEQGGRLYGSRIGWLPRIPCARVTYPENHGTLYEQVDRFSC